MSKDFLVETVTKSVEFRNITFIYQIDSLGHEDSFSGVSPISKRMLAFVAVVNTFLLQFLGYVVFENSLC